MRPSGLEANWFACILIVERPGSGALFCTPTLSARACFRCVFGAFDVCFKSLSACFWSESGARKVEFRSETGSHGYFRPCAGVRTGYNHVGNLCPRIAKRTFFTFKSSSLR